MAKKLYIYRYIQLFVKFLKKYLHYLKKLVLIKKKKTVLNIKSYFNIISRFNAMLKYIFSHRKNIRYFPIKLLYLQLTDSTNYKN